MTYFWQDETRRRPTPDVGPWLLCLDLQREFAVAGRPLHAPGVEDRIATCAEVLGDARAAGWPVIHVHRRRDGGLFSDEGGFARPVAGLEPLASEALFFRPQLSAFAASGLRRLAPPTPGTQIVMLALSLGDACVASVLQGADIGFRITIVEDLVAAPALGPYGPDLVAGVAKRLIAPCARFESARAVQRQARLYPTADRQLVTEGN